MPDDRRIGDVGESKPERIEREKKGDKQVRDLAAELQGDRIERAEELKEDRVEREDSAEENVKKLAVNVKGKNRRDLMLVAALLLGIVAAWVWQADQYREDLRSAITRNCQNDRKFRLQYKERGLVEKKLLRLEGQSNRLLGQSNRYLAIILGQSLRNPNPNSNATVEQIAFARKATAAFAATASALGLVAEEEKHLHRLIHIIPVQRCGDEFSPQGR